MSPKHHPEHPDINDAMWSQIDAIIERNRTVSGAVITVLRECQNVAGFLPVELLDYISQGLNLPSSSVYGVASFYSLFSMKPKGRHTVRLCLGTACYVKGVKEALARITNTYQVQEGETSADRRFSLEGVRCLGACALGPVVVVNEEPYGHMTPDKAARLIAKLSAQDEQPGTAPEDVSVDLQSVPPAGQGG